MTLREDLWLARLRRSADALYRCTHCKRKYVVPSMARHCETKHVGREKK